MSSANPHVEVIDLELGLWIWRLEHPAWDPEEDWQQVVTCTCIDAGGERWLIDPLLPPDSARNVWDRLDDHPPTAVAVIIPDHMRSTFDDRTKQSIDEVVERYHGRAFGPAELDPDDPPPTSALETLIPDSDLPGGLRALAAPRGRHETPIWSAEHRTIVVGDTLTERDGHLRIWGSPTHYERALPMLRSWLDLPFERVIVSHGQPVHNREAFASALEQQPWPAGPLHYAAYGGDLELVRRLVDAAADLDALDERYQKTPLEWAQISGQEDVVAYLSEAAQRRQASS